jgi:formate-dependent nitrite reductase cytochrome c552 subunit
MFAMGIPNRCAICGMAPIWQNRELVLQVDHIDGNYLDCRIENLRFLCPNCHTQTETYGRAKRSARKRSGYLTPDDVRAIRRGGRTRRASMATFP